jgi:hypothetical protein
MLIICGLNAGQRETAEKEVQDTSCRGSGGVPQLYKVPQDWGIRGLIKTISAVSEDTDKR